MSSLELRNLVVTRTGAWRFGVVLAFAATVASSLVAPVRAQSTGAEPPNPVEGRWKAVDRDITIDVMRCGKAFCGQLVKDGKCERTVLRLEALTDNATYLMALHGSADLPGMLAIPRARATVNGQGDQIRLNISGVPGNPPPMTRIMFVAVELTPAGKAACAAGATS